MSSASIAVQIRNCEAQLSALEHEIRLKEKEVQDRIDAADEFQRKKNNIH